MRAKVVLGMLADQERKFDVERRAYRDERERLLDRIMILADKPIIWDAAVAPAEEQERDVFFPDQSEDDFLMRPAR